MQDWSSTSPTTRDMPRDPRDTVIWQTTSASSARGAGKPACDEHRPVPSHGAATGFVDPWRGC